MSRRTAAALMITRGHGRDLEVFLAERAPELRFFGGYWAMPGGTLAKEDLGTAPEEEAAGLQVCATRELFEELGLLRHELPAAQSTPEALQQKRTALLAHESDDRRDKPPSPWADIIKDGQTPAPMRVLCRIETPAFAPVRYDTVFFHVPMAECTAGTSTSDTECLPDIWPGELVEGRFWSAEQALAAWREGELLLVPPVVILLEHFAVAADLDTFATAIEATANGYRSGRLHKVRFSPGIVLAPLRTPTLPPATTTNCYIVGQERLWIVDPGSPDPTEQRRLLDLLDELTANGAELQGVLLTHHHPDHVGGVHALCQARDLRVHGHPLTLDRIDTSIPRGDKIEDGGRIDLGNAPDGASGWHLTAVHTPGHDQGHLCFVESRYGAMLAGDMMSTISTIIIDPPEGNLQTYMQSLERISTLTMTTLYPAHGPAVRNGQRLVQKYIRHRRQREATLLRVLGVEPGTIEQLLPRVYWDADPRLFPYAARSLLAGLEKLSDEGRASEHDGRWQLTPTSSEQP
jgi:glyoxylase-like metal-dependent hydrolase (beta-lactamase superfamily II)